MADGNIPLPYPSEFYVYPGLPAGVESSWSVPWRAGLFTAVAPLDTAIGGPLTHNEPIDVISWTAGPGEIKVTGLEIWQQCLTLFMRHV